MDALPGCHSFSQPTHTTFTKVYHNYPHRGRCTSSHTNETKGDYMHTGPKTTMGKRISSLNSLTHGLNISGFLPCKQHQCYFIRFCLVNLVCGKDILSEIPYGFPCPVELIKYEDMVDKVAAYVPGASTELIHEWAMLSIWQERQLKFNALQADIVREVNGHQQLALAYRYRQPITSKSYKLTMSLLSLDNNTGLKKNINVGG